MGRFSMTGDEVNYIFDAVKRHAAARFTSSYTVWFAPSSAASPRKHKLEVRLAAIERQDNGRQEERDLLKEKEG
jgi:hypothetical protein